MILVRHALGEVLRGHRTQQARTLRDVADAARVSLGYLSEIERGQKEPSSELLFSVCDALGVPLSDVLAETGDHVRAVEHDARRTPEPAVPTPRAQLPSRPPTAPRGRPTTASAAHRLPVDRFGPHRVVLRREPGAVTRLVDGAVRVPVTLPVRVPEPLLLAADPDAGTTIEVRAVDSGRGLRELADAAA